MSRRTRAGVVASALLFVLGWQLLQPAEPEPLAVSTAKPTPKVRPYTRRLLRMPPPRPEPPPPEPAEDVPPQERFTCALPDDVAEQSAGGWVTLYPGISRTIAIRNQQASFELQTDALELAGRLKLEGFAPVPIELRYEQSGWTCTLGPFQRAATIAGRVKTSRGIDANTITVFGCGQRTGVDRDGGFFLDIAAEPCTLFASRRDGVFWVTSERVLVEPDSGEEIILDLDLPSWRASGVGVGLREHPEGIRVTKVLPDGPAAAAGIERGDIIVAVDGEDATTFSVNAFVQFALGPPGTLVDYTVLRDGEPMTITMEREPMGPDG